MIGKRILAFLIDYFLFMISIIVVSVFTLYDDYIMTEAKFSPFYYRCYIVVLFIVMVLFFFKDVMGGQSIGKRIMKIKVVCKETGDAPNNFRCIARNITIYIWPIEALLVLLEKEKLGDRLAGTYIKQV